MKNNFLNIIFMMFTGLCLSQTSSLTITIEGIEKSEGTIYLSLHDREETFPDSNEDSVRNKSLETFDSQASFNFEGLNKGEYAVSFFQDLNGNKELDTNIFGFPQEPVGASNLKSLARPKFAKCKFRVDGNETIKVQFMN